MGPPLLFIHIAVTLGCIVHLCAVRTKLTPHQLTDPFAPWPPASDRRSAPPQPLTSRHPKVRNRTSGRHAPWRTETGPRTAGHPEAPRRRMSSTGVRGQDGQGAAGRAAHGYRTGDLPQAAGPCQSFAGSVNSRTPAHEDRVIGKPVSVPWISPPQGGRPLKYGKESRFAKPDTGHRPKGHLPRPASRASWAACRGSAETTWRLCAERKLREGGVWRR
jgi:hypothetical protein